MPAAEGEEAELNSRVMMELEGPDGQRFELPARSGQRVPGQGFLLSFEADAQDEQALLERYVTSGAFRAARDAEAAASTEPSAPTVTVASTTAAPSTTALVADLAEELGLSLDDDDELDVAAPLEPSDREPDGPASSESRGDEEAKVDPPAPGADYPVFVVKYDQVARWDEVVATFDATRTLSVPVREPTFGPGDVALLRLTLPGYNVFEMWTRITSATDDGVDLRAGVDDEQYRKAVLYATSPSARSRREREAGEDPIPAQALRIEASVPEEDTTRMPIRRRLQRMGMDEKINLALSGNRQERMALATDSNKAVHHYLLKNVKISLDEIATMARLPSLNPDVLEKIAENPQYTQNPSVAKALVYNPKTPVRTAIRMLDRLPRNEVLLLAKRTNLNRRLVDAAKKKTGQTP